MMSDKTVRSQLNNKAGASSSTVPTASGENASNRLQQPSFQPSTAAFPSPSLSSSILNGFSSLNLAGSGSSTSLSGSSPWPFLAQQSSASSRPQHANILSGSSDSGSPLVMLQFFEVISSKLERLLSKQETMERLVHDGYESSQRSAQSNTLSLQTHMGEKLSNIMAQSQAQLSEKLVMLNAGVTRVDDHLRRIDENLSRLETRLARCELSLAGNNNQAALSQARGPSSESFNSSAVVGQIQQQAELMNRYLQEIQRTVAIAASQPNIYGSGAIPSAIAQNSALLQALLSQPYYSMYNNNLQPPPPFADIHQQQGMPGTSVSRQLAAGVGGETSGMEHQQRVAMQQYNQQQHQNNENQLPASQLPAAGTNYTLTTAQAGSGPRQITHQQSQAKNTPLASTGISKPASTLGGAGTVSNVSANPLSASAAVTVNSVSQQQQQQRMPQQHANTQQTASAKPSQGAGQGGGTLAQLLSPAAAASAGASSTSAGAGGVKQSSPATFGQSGGIFGGGKPFGSGSPFSQQLSSAADGNSQSGSRQSSANSNNNSTQQQEKAATPGASAGTANNKSATVSYAPFGSSANNNSSQPSGAGFSFIGKGGDKQGTPSLFRGGGSSAGGAENQPQPKAAPLFGAQQSPAVGGSSGNSGAAAGEKGGGFRLGNAEQPSGAGRVGSGGGGSFVFGGADTSSSGGTPGGSAAGGFRFGSNLFNAATGSGTTGGGLFSFQMPASSSSTTSAPAAAAGPSNQDQQDEEGGDEQQQNPEVYEPNVDFQPIVRLEKLDRVVTGEEDEWPILSERCKLFRFDRDKKEWKERGLGNIRLLKHRTLPQVRCVMRTEQVFKVRCNHVIGKGMRINDVEGQPNQKMWVATDYSENDQCEIELRQEMFRVRFKTAEQGTRFQELFNKAVRLAEGVAQNADFTDDIIEERSIDNAEDGATPSKASPMKQLSGSAAAAAAANGEAVVPSNNASVNEADNNNSASANRRALEESVPLFNTL